MLRANSTSLPAISAIKPHFSPNPRTFCASRRLVRNSIHFCTYAKTGGYPPLLPEFLPIFAGVPSPRHSLRAFGNLCDKTSVPPHSVPSATCSLSIAVSEPLSKSFHYVSYANPRGCTPPERRIARPECHGRRLARASGLEYRSTSKSRWTCATRGITRVEKNWVARGYK